VDRDVGEEAKPPLIHTHHRHIEWRESTCNVEHRAVTADDNGEVGHAPRFLQRKDFQMVARNMSRGERIQQHAHPAPLQEAG